jgi:hypothetical protein
MATAGSISTAASNAANIFLLNMFVPLLWMIDWTVGGDPSRMRMIAQR